MGAKATPKTRAALAMHALRDQALALPAREVETPTQPIEIFVDELMGYVVAARAHQAALTAVGLDPAMLVEFESCALALRQAQAAWRQSRRRGRDELTQRRIDAALALRREAMAATKLALRHSRDGQRRLRQIRARAGLDDLVADLRDLSALVADAEAEFKAIKLQPEALAQALRQAHDALQERLSAERVARSKANDKELRDRYYTLCLAPLRELRAYAKFAFRADLGQQRRRAFSSAYERRRKRQQRKGSSAKAQHAKAQEQATQIAGDNGQKHPSPAPRDS